MAVKRSGLGRGLDALIRDTGKKEEKTEAKSAKPSSGKKTDGSTGAGKNAEKAGSEPEKPPKKTAVKKAAGDESGKSRTARTSGTKTTAGRSEAKKKEQPKAAKTEAETLPVSGERIVPISLVEPNREQPRKIFDEEAINELADSIRQYGVISPLLVQVRDKHYEIIAGERRWRACRIAGLKEVPVVIRDYSKQEAVEVALIENIQRQDLNPIEEARAYRNLMEDFSMNQEQVAGKVSKSRAAVANAMRLLKLDERVQNMLVDRTLSEGHARALLAVEDGDRQAALAEEIIKEHASVRQTEQKIRNLTRPQKKKEAPARDEQREAVMRDLEERLRKSLSTRVTIKENGSGRGQIEIEYYSDEELEAVCDCLIRAGEIGE